MSTPFVITRLRFEYCYATMGASRMLYGTDHPFGRPGQVAEPIQALDCSAEDRELIYHGTLESPTKGVHSAGTDEASGQ
jgi:hypothetical protein